ncbi:unnamed protein product, partial [Rotaria sp. Silwood2]
ENIQSIKYERKSHSTDATISWKKFKKDEEPKETEDEEPKETERHDGC